MPQKPPSIESDAFKSAKWDELCALRDFEEKDADSLELLCVWYQIEQNALEELGQFGGQTAYQLENGAIKTFPQINTLNMATNRIVQLERRLGLDERVEEKQPERQQATVLTIIQGRHDEKHGTARAAGA